MMAKLLVTDNAFEFILGVEAIGSRRALDAPAVQALTDFAARYAVLRQVRDDTAGQWALGQALYQWLDGDRAPLSQLRDRADRPFVFEISAPHTPSPAEWALLHAPWELLADAHGFLAQQALLGFSPVRRLGRAETAPALDDYRLGLTFMAAAPRGQQALDYEAEESAILRAVGDRAIDLWVEESGDPQALSDRLAALGELPTLHVSCHGDNAWRPAGDPHAVPRPVLWLEDAEGNAQPTDAEALIKALRVAPPRLVFLSACLSAAAAGTQTPLPRGVGDKRAEGAPDPTIAPMVHSLATALVEGGVPAVLGWDGSVADGAATAFAQALYGGLAKRLDLATAVAEARRGLLNAPAETVRRDWPLARLWLGPSGGGPIVGGMRKRSLLPATHGQQAFLIKERQQVPVASHEMFVGRRRPLQAALRALRDGRHAGVLVHGLGRLGKSSLAARIANRRRDLALAVVFEHYGALSVVEALERALRRFPPVRTLLREGKAAVREAPDRLEDLLIDLLTGPCAQADAEGAPVLLVIDDLERVLVADPQGGRHRVDPQYAPVLASLLQAFDPSEKTDSRLLLTSRFPFTLEGLEARLHPLPLPPLSETARRKLELRQVVAAQEGKARLEKPELAARALLLPRVRAVARGNPGLQALIGQKLVLSKEVPLARARAALEAMEAWLAGGALPEEAQVCTFLEDLAIDTLLELAGASGQDLLRGLTLFQVPVPLPVTEVMAQTLGGAVPRLGDLGLLDEFEDLIDPRVMAQAVNALVVARLAPLSATEQLSLAKHSLPPLFTAWGGIAGGDRRPIRSSPVWVCWRRTGRWSRPVPQPPLPPWKVARRRSRLRSASAPSSCWIGRAGRCPGGS